MRRHVWMLGLILFLAGWIAADLIRTPLSSAQESARGPRWSHAMDLRVRKAGERDFTKDTKTWSVEVFRDENNGNLIYISESGSISVVPATK